MLKSRRRLPSHGITILDVLELHLDTHFCLQRKFLRWKYIILFFFSHNCSSMNCCVVKTSFAKKKKQQQKNGFSFIQKRVSPASQHIFFKISFFICLRSFSLTRWRHYMLILPFFFQSSLLLLSRHKTNKNNNN